MMSNNTPDYSSRREFIKCSALLAAAVSVGGASPSSEKRQDTAPAASSSKVIDYHVHYFLGSHGMPDTIEEYAEKRMGIMDYAGVDTSVLFSLHPVNPPTDDATQFTLEFGRQQNDQMSELAKRFPSKFIGSCLVPYLDGKIYLDELQRGVHELGLKGAAIEADWINVIKNEKIL